MKKIKLLTVLVALCSIVCGGCSCSKITETTYENAAVNLKNTDGVSFSRIEKEFVEGEEFYTHKRIDAMYIFDSNKYVNAMQYYKSISLASTAGNTMTNLETEEYYYSAEQNAIYYYLKVGSQKEERVKKSGIAYHDEFNINKCEDLDCSRMIVDNLYPVFQLNEVVDFMINETDDVGEISFKAICPSFESCSSSSQMIDYKIVLGDDGNIKTMSYMVERGNRKYYIDYTFRTLGSHNVEIKYPTDLENYIEK